MRLAAMIASPARSRISKTPSTTSRQPSSICRSASVSSGCAETKTSTTVRPSASGRCKMKWSRRLANSPSSVTVLPMPLLTASSSCREKRRERANSTSWRFNSLQRSSRSAASDGAAALVVPVTRDPLRTVCAERRYVGDEPAPEGLHLNVQRNVPGVHGKAIHFNDPQQWVLRGHVGTLELRREVVDPQQIADLLCL